MTNRDCQQHSDCDQKTNRHKRNRRQIAKPNLDGKPRGTPYDAKCEPSCRHSPPCLVPITFPPGAFRFHPRATIALWLRFVKRARADDEADQKYALARRSVKLRPRPRDTRSRDFSCRASSGLLSLSLQPNLYEITHRTYAKSLSP